MFLNREPCTAVALKRFIVVSCYFLCAFQKYESLKDSIPDVSWMKDYLPEQKQLDRLSQLIYQFRSRISLPEIPDLKVYFHMTQIYQRFCLKFGV